MATNDIVQASVRPAVKWRILSLLIRTLGRASRGIDIGYHHGFDSGDMLDYVYENQARGRRCSSPPR